MTGLLLVISAVVLLAFGFLAGSVREANRRGGSVDVAAENRALRAQVAQLLDAQVQRRGVRGWGGGEERAMARRVAEEAAFRERAGRRV